MVNLAFRISARAGKRRDKQFLEGNSRTVLSREFASLEDRSSRTEFSLPEIASVMPVADSSYVKYLSPTFITSDYEAEFETALDTGSPDLVKRKANIGLLAHSILEPLGMKSVQGLPQL